MDNGKKFLQALGQRIRDLRLERNWSQEELAKRSGLHRTYISSVEQGKRNLAALNLRGLARAYRINLAELFDGIA